MKTVTQEAQAEVLLGLQQGLMINATMMVKEVQENLQNSISLRHILKPK